MAYSLAHSTAQHSAASFQSAREAEAQQLVRWLDRDCPCLCREPATTVHTAPEPSHTLVAWLFPQPNQLDATATSVVAP